MCKNIMISKSQKGMIVKTGKAHAAVQIDFYTHLRMYIHTL